MEYPSGKVSKMGYPSPMQVKALREATGMSLQDSRNALFAALAHEALFAATAQPEALSEPISTIVFILKDLMHRQIPKGQLFQENIERILRDDTSS